MSNRHSAITAARIVYGLWLIFDESGSIRLTRARPAIGRGERAMELSLAVPRSLFRTPELSASITIESSDNPPPYIDISAAETALRQAIGCDVEISIKGDGQ